MALPQQKNDATAERLGAMSRPDGGAWIGQARDAALVRVETMGLPHRRDEYWKYTRPETLVDAKAPHAGVYEPHETQVFGDIDRLKIVFVDGVFDAEASDELSLAGVEIETLQSAGAADIHWARDLYGVLETRGQSPVERPLAALNSAFAGQGVVIRVTANAAKPINLTYLQRQADTDVMFHHVIKVEDGADLTLLENGPAGARLNSVMEVEIADGGAFHHVRTQGRAHERRAATHLFTRLGKESTFKSFTLTVNGAMTRNEAVIELTGDDAVAHVAGAALGDGATGPFHHDDTVFITHDAENCESRQVFKKVLRNGAVGVFQGKILVTQTAQKTDGYQISQSLLLDDDSQFLAKPELEIYADDVACSHGSTSGAIDEEGLFYLRSRGVPKSEATDLMVIAFVAEALEEIEDEAISADVLARLEGWLERRRG
ncbi:SufD family Fe-S cluster assembly protein [Tropicimonas sp. TH_r6]|uniref:SufB/SufD family protein n=1 Tax=Tropicimonas sp. TH_r6 TaxID=3082085 RepID=UPI002952F917|nr:SufD family Fe-S cluster assembly protein [Tropicimonas sp. TH_r6]MDV7144985.1 SufD family Fe-S cluster assembly protein [Tropicimonas sp. TH_r6]